MKQKHRWYEFIFPVFFLLLSIIILIEGATPGSQSGAQSKTVAAIFDTGPLAADIVAPTSLSIQGQDKIYLQKEESYSVSFLPENTSDQRVTYSLQDNEGEALLSNNKVTALKEGEVTLVATSVANPSLKATKTIFLEKEKITSIEISLEETSLLCQKSEKLSIQGNRSISLNEIEFICSDPSVLTLDERMYLHSHQVGEVDISIKEKEGEVTSNTLHVSVIEGDFVAPTSLTYLDQDIYVGESVLVEPTFNENCSDTNFYMESSSSEVIIQNQKILGKKEGESVITLHSIQNPSLTSTFKVNIQEVKAKSLNVSNASIQYGKGTTVSYTLESEKEGLKVTHPEVDFTSSDESIASVDDTGYVLGKKKGTVMLTVVWKRDPNIKAECSIAITSLDGHVFDQIESVVRKLIGHFGSFFATAIFAVLSVFFLFYRHGNKKLSIILISILFVYGLALAFLSEMAQLFTVNRGPALSDVGIDFGGYAAGFILTALIVLLIYHFYRKRKERAVAN